MKKYTLDRFRQIVSVLTYYGIGLIKENKAEDKKKQAENFRKAFEKLGPTFIKIGQILSTRPDIVPEEYIIELKKLQNDAVKMSIEDVKNVFREEMKKEINECFLEFNEVPLASASVSQVHEGILKDGRKVVIKVQRPNIKKLMEEDIRILIRLARLIKGRIKETLVDPLEALNEIKAMTEKELDFRIEGENLKQFKENNINVIPLKVPDVVNEFSAEKVLVMEKIEGYKINDKETLISKGYDLDDISQKLVSIYFKQVFKDGFFHGDPHPGNIFISEKKICFIDFGIMGEISPEIKAALNDVIIALGTKDINKIVDFILSIGVKNGKVERNVLYMDVENFLDIYLGTSLKNIKISQMLQELMFISSKNNILMPRDLVLLARSMVIFEGVITELSPNVDILTLLMNTISSGNKFFFLKDMTKEELIYRAYDFAKSTFSIPTKFLELVDSVKGGRAKFLLQVEDLDKSIQALNKMVNRVVFSMIIAAMIIGSSLIIYNQGPIQIYGMSLIGLGGYFVAAILGLWLIISIIKSGTL
ncbi:ABC1 kinase family protein [Clostridium sp. 'White wine YQ']|uniref:ABC1 kinase family protein n=1 Tax=Clostridium sp. 'White wine YQ' TaxID=3027474 RepID=UPI0023650EBC|nr:AarF/UbiB family protein [Clostridium sp. 'White wine YQ']MDD7795110.1 AarF/UbiB family protein [Clostridium sp. 'White wine YQ']